MLDLPDVLELSELLDLLFLSHLLDHSYLFDLFDLFPTFLGLGTGTTTTKNKEGKDNHHHHHTGHHEQQQKSMGNSLLKGSNHDHLQRNRGGCRHIGSFLLGEKGKKNDRQKTEKKKNLSKFEYVASVKSR